MSGILDSFAERNSGEVVAENWNSVPHGKRSLLDRRACELSVQRLVSVVRHSQQASRVNAAIEGPRRKRSSQTKQATSNAGDFRPLAPAKISLRPKCDCYRQKFTAGALLRDYVKQVCSDVPCGTPIVLNNPNSRHIWLDDNSGSTVPRKPSEAHRHHPLR